jgi:hypothetical protein
MRSGYKITGLIFCRLPVALAREGERLKTIRIPVGLAHQKQMLTLKKSVKLFEKFVA